MRPKQHRPAPSQLDRMEAKLDQILELLDAGNGAAGVAAGRRRHQAKRATSTSERLFLTDDHVDVMRAIARKGGRLCKQLDIDVEFGRRKIGKLCGQLARAGYVERPPASRGGAESRKGMRLTADGEAQLANHVPEK